MHNFGKVLTAMITPFTADNEVDFDKAKKIAQYLLANGSDGIVLAGSTGESATLTVGEKLELFSVVKKAVGNKAKIIAGTGTNSTKTSLELSIEAEKTGVDAVMLVVPYYNKPSQEGLYNHFKTVAEAINLPVVLYNIPGRSVINLLPETVVKLAQVENIVALKESAGNMDQFSELKRLLPKNFLLYSGDDSLTLPLLALGAQGIISVTAHIAGNEIKEMVEAFSSGDHQKALQIHLNLLPVFKTMFITSNPVPLKTALNLMGMQVGSVRPPLCDASNAETERIMLMLKKLKLIN